LDEPGGFQTAVQPYVVAALLCDQTITEAGTNRKTLVNTYDTLAAERFPFSNTFALFVKITDAEGAYRLRIDLANVSENRMLVSLNAGEFSVPSRLAGYELLLSIAAEIPSQGMYEFRIYANDAFLTSIPFTVNRLTVGQA
jgi:hypothetical protein